MTTRLDDSISIIGEELALEVEKAFQEKIEERSRNDLVYKSELVDKITKNLIEDIDKEVNKTNLTTETKPVSEIAEKSKIEKCGVDYKPYGGSKSMEDIKKYQDAQNLEYNARSVYYMFETAMSNILTDDESDATNKITEMSSLIKEFQNAMKTENLLSMKSKTEDNMKEKTEVITEKSEVVDNTVNSLIERISKLESTINHPANEVKVENTVAKSLGNLVEKELEVIMSKSANERQVLMQNLVNKFGETLRNIDEQLGGNQVNEVEKSLNDKFNTLNVQISQLVSNVQSLNTKVNNLSEVRQQNREVPIAKSFVVPVAPPQTQNKTMSIADIALRSTLGK